MNALKKVLITGPDASMVQGLEKVFRQNNVIPFSSRDGRNCQLTAFRENVQGVIMDVETKNHSCLEVLRYLRTNFPETGVILLAANSDRIKDLGLEIAELRKVGVREVFVAPFEPMRVVDCFEGRKEFDSWKDVIPKKSNVSDEEIVGQDDEYDRIHVSTLYSSGAAVMNYYLRLAPQRYILVLNRGDSFIEQDILRLVTEKNINYLHFLKADRAAYMNFVNEVLDQSIQKSAAPKQTVARFEDVVDKFLSEIVDSGVRPEIYDEGLRICNNMYTFIQRQPDLKKIMAALEERCYQAHELQFLTAFYATVISKNVPWASRRTVEFTTMGSLLHGVGKLKLPDEVLGVAYSQLSDEQKCIFQNYPRLGFDIVSAFPHTPEPVRQIIYQHREKVNGTGFPNNLTFNHIFPLAKIVSTSLGFAELIIEEKLKPLDALRIFVSDPFKVAQYDAETVKSLIKSFIKRPQLGGKSHER